MFTDDDDDDDDVLNYGLPDYFYNVGTDNDRDYDKDGYDDVGDDLNALIMLLCHLLELPMP